mmetsp:Transcript_15473/g.35364  ORF Transcript_15473/g.35364 Transcript_15473/m.35364 type:complete len:236 (-) Transcript_15473:613-1320(-)
MMPSSSEETVSGKDSEAMASALASGCDSACLSGVVGALLPNTCLKMSTWRSKSHNTVRTATLRTRLLFTIPSLSSSSIKSSAFACWSFSSSVLLCCFPAARRKRSACCWRNASSSAFRSSQSFEAVPSSACTAHTAPVKCNGVHKTLQAAQAANNPPNSAVASDKPIWASIPGKSMPCEDATVAPAIVKHDVNFDVTNSGAPYLSTGPSSQATSLFNLSVVHCTALRTGWLILFC